MANRVLVGRPPNLSCNPYGVFVSKSGQDVTGTTGSNFAFRTDITDSTAGITSLNGQVLTARYRGAVTYTHNATGGGSRNKTIDVITWPRSDFNDGTYDRCPLVFCQTSIIDDTSKQNVVGCMRFKNNGNHWSTYMGFRFNVFPYYTTTHGKLQLTSFAEWYADPDDGEEPATSTNNRVVYYAVCDPILS